MDDWLHDWLSITPDGLLTGTPTENAVGTSNIHVGVSDGQGGTDVEHFELTITNLNDAPEFDPLEISILSNTLSQLKADQFWEWHFNAIDPDIEWGVQDQLTFTAENLPSWMHIDPNGKLSVFPKVKILAQ